MTGESDSPLPSYVDPRLWFEMTGCDGPHYFVDDNPHILGRMYAYCPIKRDTTRVSKSEITARSDEAEYFMRGFLSGSEPPPPPLDDEGRRDQAAWERAIKIYHETGTWKPDGPGRLQCALAGQQKVSSLADNR